MRLKNRKKSAAAIKSMKVGTDELKDLIKGAVKEAMGEEDDTGDDGSDTAAALDGITAEDMADIIEQAVDNANEKRKSRKDAGEEVGDLTADEVIQEAAEIIDSMTADEGIEIFLLALITILLVAAIFIEVVCRYFLFISAAWAEEFTRYLFIWLTYIGSAYAICDNSHTEIDVLKQVLMKIKGPAREKWLKALEVAAIVSTFAFLVVFAKLFFDYMMKIFGTTQTSPTMRIPMGWVYLPVFVGIVLAALHEVYMLAACLLGGDKKSAAEADN